MKDKNKLVDPKVWKQRLLMGKASAFSMVLWNSFISLLATTCSFEKRVGKTKAGKQTKIFHGKGNLMLCDLLTPACAIRCWLSLFEWWGQKLCWGRQICCPGKQRNRGQKKVPLTKKSCSINQLRNWAMQPWKWKEWKKEENSPHVLLEKFDFHAKTFSSIVQRGSNYLHSRQYTQSWALMFQKKITFWAL